MRLYVVDKDNPEHKIYLNFKANSRSELKNLIKANAFRLNNNIYNIKDVIAEADQKTTTSLIAGGALGIFGGIPGVLIGSVAGAFLGNEAQKSEDKATNMFNQSRLA